MFDWLIRCTVLGSTHRLLPSIAAVGTARCKRGQPVTGRSPFCRCSQRCREGLLSGATRKSFARSEPYRFWTLTGLITDGTRGRPTRCCPGEIQLVGNRFRMDGQTNSSTAIERAMRLWCGEAMEHVSSSRFLGGGLAAED